jgi:hypothetical protein
MQARIKPDLWYHRPGYLKIGLVEGEAVVTALGNDVEIIKVIGGKRFQALVPTASLGENMGYVPAAYAGKVGDKIILYLPTSNDGRPTWEIDESALKNILVE